MRNDCVFNNATPNRHELVRSILDEAKLWLLAGAKELGRLPLHTRPPNAYSLASWGWTCTVFSFCFLLAFALYSLRLLMSSSNI
jgi:hypothetical protein